MEISIPLGLVAVTALAALTQDGWAGVGGAVATGIAGLESLDAKRNWKEASSILVLTFFFGAIGPGLLMNYQPFIHYFSIDTQNINWQGWCFLGFLSGTMGLSLYHSAKKVISKRATALINAIFNFKK